MLGHELHRGGSFWSFLLSVDKDLADSSRQQGCSCGGRHCANYPRAPRAGPDHLPEEYRSRFSFCCDRDGCRRRMTPPSVRFLGRKVYLGAVVILISPVHRLSRRSYAVDDREKRLETPRQGRPGARTTDRAGTARIEAVDRAQRLAARIRERLRQAVPRSS
jgi:hypothetical protein